MSLKGKIILKERGRNMLGWWVKRFLYNWLTQDLETKLIFDRCDIHFHNDMILSIFGHNLFRL